MALLAAKVERPAQPQRSPEQQAALQDLQTAIRVLEQGVFPLSQDQCMH